MDLRFSDLAGPLTRYPLRATLRLITFRRLNPEAPLSDTVSAFDHQNHFLVTGLLSVTWSTLLNVAYSSRRVSIPSFSLLAPDVAFAPSEDQLSFRVVPAPPGMTSRLRCSQNPSYTVVLPLPFSQWVRRES